MTPTRSHWSGRREWVPSAKTNPSLGYSTLKTWFDYVLRAGITFKYSESGPVGLLEGKRAIVIESRGGLYSEGPAKVMDSQEPHLRNLLGFMGITNITFVRVEKLAFGTEARERAIDAARAELAEAIPA